MEETNQDQKESSIAFTTVSEKWYKKDSFRKILNITTGVLIVLLAPFTVAAIISQNAIPGDSLYPLKRSLENMVLTAAAVSPATRAAFRTDLANRRFTEAQKLLVDKRNASGLPDFVSEIQTTQLELQKVSDPKQKEELTQNLIVSITQYQEKLSQVQSQIGSEASLQALPTNIPSRDSTNNLPSPTAIPNAVSPQIERSIASPTTLVTLSPTAVPRTPTQPVAVPTPASTNPSPTIGGAISQTQEDLKRIRRELEREQRRNRSRSEPESEQGQSIVPNQEVSNKERESRGNQEKAKSSSKQSRED